MDSDIDIEDLLRDTPESGATPVRSTTLERPLTPGSASITVGAAMKWAVNTVAVTERMLFWLQDDISFLESYSPGAISPEKELGEILEFEVAALIDSEPGTDKQDIVT